MGQATLTLTQNAAVPVTLPQLIEHPAIHLFFPETGQLFNASRNTETRLGEREHLTGPASTTDNYITTRPDRCELAPVCPWRPVEIPLPTQHSDDDSIAFWYSGTLCAPVWLRLGGWPITFPRVSFPCVLVVIER